MSALIIKKLFFTSSKWFRLPTQVHILSRYDNRIFLLPAVAGGPHQNHVNGFSGIDCCYL